MAASGGPTLPHFLVGATRPLWRRLRRQHSIAPERGRRAAVINAVTSMGSLIAAYEHRRHGARITRTTIDPSPIFLIGHWQAGHSLLHYLLACDPQFGQVSLAHCLLPSSFLTMRPLLRRLLAGRLPSTRGVDTLPLGLDAPQGDDFALANLSELSFYHCYVFPEDADRIFRRSVLLEDVTPDALRAWRAHYTWLMRKVAYDTGRARLVLRNASNTARIRELLTMFPTAKFIHVYRNPFTVYAALTQRWQALLSTWALQPFDLHAMEQHTLAFYEQTMQRYFTDRALIPAGNLVEVRHEALAADPLDTLASLYRDLDLTGFDDARPRLARYLADHPGAVGAGHPLDPSVVARIRTRWGFALEQLGYTEPAA